MKLDELPIYLEFCEVFGISPTSPFAYKQYLLFKESGLTL